MRRRWIILALLCSILTANEVILKLDTKGHTSIINDIIVTKSGDIISASDDKTIRVWDSATGKEKRKILGQIGGGSEGKIYAVALSPNEKFLVVGGFFGKKPNFKEVGFIRIYNYKTGKLLKILKSHIQVISDLAFSSDGKYLISSSLTAKIWDGKTFKLLDTIKFHTNEIYSVKIIKKDNRYFVITVGLDNQIAMYNIKTKKIIKSHKLSYKLHSLAVSQKHIAVCGLNKEIQIYDYNLRFIKTIQSETKPWGLNYSPNGKFLISGAGDYPDNINIYNSNYQKIQSLKRHKNLVKAVAFLDNKTAISGGGNNSEIYIWSTKTAQILNKIEGVGNVVLNIGIKKNEISWSNILKHDNTKFKKIIDLKKFQIKDYNHNKNFNTISTRNGIHSLSYRYGSDDSLLDININGRTVKSIVRDSTNGYLHRCYGFYKHFIVSGGTNGHLKIYNLLGKEVLDLVGHIGDIWSIALDEDRLISVSSDQTILVWDLSKLKRKHKEKKIDEKSISYAMKELRFTREQVIEISKEANINIYLTPQIQPELSLFISKSNEYIAWTPEGYFNASKKGMNYLYFHLNQGADKEAKVIPMQKLYDHFYRPDLVKLKLAGEEEAYQKAIGKLDFKEALRNPPPVVKIDDMSIKTKKERIKLSFNLKDEGGGVGVVRIYQEGKLIQTIGEGEIKRQSANIDTIIEQEKLDKKAKKSQKERDEKVKAVIRETPINQQVAKVETSTITNKAGNYTIEVELKSGENEISIEAFNKTNTVTSYRESITINANIPKYKPKLYAIIAGVNEFESKNVNNLKYSENDAKAIKEIVQKEQGKIFERVEVSYLVGKDVTRANILNSAQEIAKKARLEDTVLFYISTHGRSAKGKLYLVPQNNKKFDNWIDFKQTFKAVQSIKALNQIFVIDACESGKANDIVSAVYDSRASVLAKSSGVHMLLATTKGTSAFEHPDPTIKNGVFTHRILEALKSKKTDKNNDNLVSVLELSKKLREPQGNSEYQYPVIRNVGKDIWLSNIK